MYLYVVLLYTCIALHNEGTSALRSTTPMSRQGKHHRLYSKTAELINLVNKFYNDDNSPGYAGQIPLKKTQSNYKRGPNNDRDIDEDYYNTKYSKKEIPLESVMKLMQKNYDAYKNFAQNGENNMRVHIIKNPEVLESYRQIIKRVNFDRSTSSSSSESADEGGFNRNLKEVLRRNSVNFRLASDVSSEATKDDLEATKDELEATKDELEAVQMESRLSHSIEEVKPVEEEVTPFKLPYEYDEMKNIDIIMNSGEIKQEVEKITEENVHKAAENDEWQFITKNYKWGEETTIEKNIKDPNWEKTKRRETADEWNKKSNDWDQKDRNYEKRNDRKKSDDWSKKDNSWEKKNEWEKKADDWDVRHDNYDKKSDDWNQKSGDQNKKADDWNKKSDDWNKNPDTHKKGNSWEKKDNWNKNNADSKTNQRDKKDNDWNRDINWDKKDTKWNRDDEWTTKNKKTDWDKKDNWDNKDTKKNKDNDWDKPKKDYDNDWNRKEKKKDDWDTLTTKDETWDKKRNSWDKKNSEWKTNLRTNQKITEEGDNKRKNKQDEDLNWKEEKGFNSYENDVTKAFDIKDRFTTKEGSFKKVVNDWDSYVPKDDYYKPKKNKRVDSYEMRKNPQSGGAGYSFGRTPIPFVGQKRIYDK